MYDNRLNSKEQIEIDVLNAVLKTSVKLAADSTFFNEYSHTYLCRRSSLVYLIELDELYLMVQSDFP